MIPVAILAGGLATRLRPLTETIPKVLIEIAGEPFLSRQLNLLRRRGVERVVLCVGFLGEQIREFARDGSRFGLQIDYSFDGPRLLGTGGAIRRALPFLGDAFFVLYGDSYLTCDYEAVESAFRAAGKPGLMTVFRNEGRWDASNVEFSDGRIVDYDKAARGPRMRHIDYGLGAFHSAAFESLPEDSVIDLAGVYRTLVRQGELSGYEVSERFYEIGSVAGIHDLEAYLAGPKRRAVFLDRDGVLNQAIVRAGRPYPPSNLNEFQIVPGAVAALLRLKEAGFLLVVVTNQPDAARGTQSRERIEELNGAVRAALPVDDFYVCFHGGTEGCPCRKPKPGLLLKAAADRNVDLGRSFLVGDRWSDVDAGAAAGCRTILIDRHYDERPPEHPPDCRVETLASAVDWVLRVDGC